MPISWCEAKNGASHRRSPTIPGQLQLESPNARANPERDDYIRAAARRVAQRRAALDQHDTALEGVDGQPGEHR